MSLPKSINVMGHKIKIVLNDDPDNHGSTNPQERIIYIRKQDSAEVQRATLLHETIHCILYFSGLSNLLAAEMEEAIVVAVESGLFPLVTKTWSK